MLVAGAVALVTLVSVGDDAAAPTAPATTSPASASATSATTSPVTLSRPATTRSASTIAGGRGTGPDRVVALEEVWLVDRGDGTFDWGVVVESVSGGDRGAIDVDAELLAADGAVVATDRQRLGALAAGSSVVVGGQVEGPVEPPRRVEVEVSAGEELAEPTQGPDALRVVALQRRRMPGGAPDDEAIVGRIRSTTDADLEDLRLALVWRDEAGDVVASRFHAVDRVRSDVEARFEVPIGDDPAAVGVPEVRWSHGPHSG